MLRENSEKFLETATKEQLENLKWLIENPAFEERPVDIVTFVEHPEYLGLKYIITGNKGYGCRPRLLEKLQAIFDADEQYEEFVLMCGIGWGKDFASSIVLTYQTYRLQCLKDPQNFYGLSKGSTIHLMLMSINETHARDVLFSEVKARIDNAGWNLKRLLKYNTKIVTEFQFQKNVSLIPGNSKNTTFVGYNIFCGVIDEGDDYTVTKERNDATEGYNSIKQRILSRFRNKGMLGIIGSPKTVDGFMMTMYNNAEEVTGRYRIWVPTWESLIGTPMLSGEYFSDETTKGEKVPIEYKNAFRNDPEGALRDLCAKPAMAKQPYITLYQKIDEMFDESPLLFNTKEDGIGWLSFVDNIKGDPNEVYYAHLDLAINRKKGDRLGFAVGHTVGWVEIDGTDKPKIKIDIAMAVTAPPGGEIQFDEIKQMIYFLESRGFTFEHITADSWNSVDMLQSLNAHGITATMLSVDREMLPYENFKKSIYEGRIKCHAYPLLKKELERLELVNGEKVDHPARGSKDVCLSGDTGILLLDGSAEKIKNLVGKEFEVYSCLPDGSIKIGCAKNVHSNGIREDMVCVMLDNGEKVECTYDHLFMMRDGSYKNAGELLEGDSLMPLYKKISVANPKNGLNGYEMVKDNLLEKFVYTHQLVAKNMLNFSYGNNKNQRQVIHHKDFNKRNNKVKNLIAISWNGHMELHRKVASENLKELWKNKEFSDNCKKRAAKLGEKTGKINITKYNKSGERIRKLKENGTFKRNGTKVLKALWMDEGFRNMTKERMTGKNNHHWRGDVTLDRIIKIAEESVSQKEMLLKLECTQKVLHRVLVANNISLYDFGKKYYKKFYSKSFYNHKVLMVKKCKPSEVYDMTVENYNNFAIKSGIFVHNCDAVAGVAHNITKLNNRVLNFSPRFVGRREF